MRRSVCNTGASNAGRSLCVQISREWSYPMPIYWYHSKGNWLHYYVAAEFLYNKLCSRLIVLYCRNCPKDDKPWHFDPHFEEDRGGVEPCLMACWKACLEFLLSVIELLFLPLAVEALQGKMCQNSLPSGGVGHLEPRFQGEEVVPLPIYWYHLKGNWLHYNLAADSFYIMKLCSRLLVLYCRNCQQLLMLFMITANNVHCLATNKNSVTVIDRWRLYPRTMWQLSIIIGNRTIIINRITLH